MQHPVRVGVLFGGTSREHDVSLQSAANVLASLPGGYTAIPIGITKSGDWFRYDGDPAAIRDGSWAQNGAALHPLSLSLSHGGFRTAEGDLPLDVIFPVLHGAGGEDGVQGLLDYAGIPYVGCGMLAGAVCMDKATAKARVALDAPDIPTARSLTFSREDLASLPGAVAKAEQMLGYPLFCKPSRGGSSVGTAMAEDRKTLVSALLAAAAEDATVLCEEAVRGTETEVALLETPEGLLVSRAGCIHVPTRFYDYDAKYRTPVVRLSVPADIPREAEDRCRRYAERLFRLFGCRQLARADFFVTEDGNVLFNEINTLPGFTSGSMYPLLLQNAGYSLPELLDALITGALR